EDVRRLPTPRLASARAEVSLDFPGLNDGMRIKFEQRIGTLLSACGCREGSIAVLIYLVAAPILVALGPLAPGSVLGWVALVGGLLAASMAGKVAGLVLAQIRLLRVLSELEEIIREQGMAG